MEYVLRTVDGSPRRSAYRRWYGTNTDGKGGVNGTTRVSEYGLYGFVMLVGLYRPQIHCRAVQSCSAC